VLRWLATCDTFAAWCCSHLQDTSEKRWRRKLMSKRVATRRGSVAGGDLPGAARHGDTHAES
jgi:hypothetical protein